VIRRDALLELLELIQPVELESQELRTACKVQPRWLNSQRGCSWYFIVSKVATVKRKNQYYAVIDLRSEGNAAPLSIVETIT